MSERVLVSVDVSNLYYCANKKFRKKVDYSKYMAIALGNAGTLYRAFAYGAQFGNQAEGFLNCLRSFGYEPKYKQPKEFNNPDYHIDLEALEYWIGSVETDHGMRSKALESLAALKKLLRAKKDIRKANHDVEIAIDIVRLIERVDTVVLGSADSDFAPLVTWIREKGCKCIVYACNISHELRAVASECIEIDDRSLTDMEKSV